MILQSRCWRGLAATGLFVTGWLSLGAPAFAEPISTLEVDAADAPMRIFHVKQTLPMPKGHDVLVFPRWLPGEHGPTGPINDLVNLRFRVAGKDIAWSRDATDPYSFRLVLPQGAALVEATFDAVTGVGGRGAPSPTASSSQLAVIKWNTMLLYPQGVDPKRYLVSASVRLPVGWSWATALEAAGGARAQSRFIPTPLETLIDSPLLAGAYTRRHDLTPPGGPPHALFAAAESERALDVTPSTLAAYRSLVLEAGALFGSRPYRKYLFLLALSNHLPHGGLEHHESSDNRVFEDTWVDESRLLFRSGLLPHEMVHSWNGKYRRPHGLATADYQQPYDTRMLWVYEGLTSYLGEVLAARSGLRSAEAARDILAITAAGMDAQVGRHWRSIADTATAAPVLNHAVKQWRSLRRGLDYYPEMVLVWLEADAIIRRVTNGQRSLDDFCRDFFGGEEGAVRVKPYEREDVLAALASVAAYDWGAFFAKRVDTINKAVSPEALAAVGWKLTFEAKPTAAFRAVEGSIKEINMTYSLGLVMAEDGVVADVLLGSPAARAAVAPAMQILAVNGRRFAPDRVRAAVDETIARGWVDLLLENADFFSTKRVFWKHGSRYPRLTRDDRQADLLTPILQPRGSRSGDAAN